MDGPWNDFAPQTPAASQDASGPWSDYAPAAKATTGPWNDYKPEQKLNNDDAYGTGLGAFIKEVPNAVGTALKGLNRIMQPVSLMPPDVNSDEMKRAQDFAEKETGTRPPDADPAYKQKIDTLTQDPNTTGLAKAGQAAQDASAAIKTNPEAEAAHPIATMVGKGIADIGTAVLSSMAAGPEAGAGFFGTNAFESEMEKAKAEGKEGPDATRAAAAIGTLNAALGSVDVMAVLKPVEQSAPSALSWAAAKLTQAARGGLTFAGVGEAQEYLGEQFRKEYDDKAQYTFDPNRVLASFITGGAMGVAHPAGAPDATKGMFNAEGLTGDELNQPPAAQLPAPKAGATDQPAQLPAPRAVPGEFVSDPASGQVRPLMETEKYNTSPSDVMISDPKTGQVRPMTNEELSQRDLQMSAMVESGNTPDVQRAAAQRLNPVAADAEQALTDIGSGKGAQPRALPPPSQGNEMIAGPEGVRPSTQGEDFQNQQARDAAQNIGMTPDIRAAIAKRANIDTAAAETNTNPTPAQVEAGNYKKGQINYQGLPISIENPAGSMRRGTSADGTPWQAQMPVHYGYIKKTEGADGDHMDAFIGPNPDAQNAYVVDQTKPDGSFDEHKVLLGFDNPAQAVAAYTGSFSDGKGQQRIGGLASMTVPDLKNWLTGDTTKPLQPGVGKGIISNDQNSPQTAQQAAASPRGTAVRDARQALSDDRRQAQGNSGAGRPGRGNDGQFRLLKSQVQQTHTLLKAASDALAKAGLASPQIHELKPTARSAQQFANAITAAKNNTPFGAAVHVYTPEEYKQMRTFVTADGQAGFALKGNDIVSVFNNKKDGAASAMILHAQMQGGRKLDAFDTVLPVIYAQNGFRVISRMKWNDQYAPEGWDKQTFAKWNNGEPDVVFMAYDPARTTDYQPGEGVLVNDYDTAVALQEAHLFPTDKPAFQVSDPDQDHLGFFSGLTEAVKSMKQEKAPASQWLGAIKNAKGVKPDELQWTGLADQLEQGGNKPLSKQEILDYLKAHAVDLSEQELTEDGDERAPEDEVDMPHARDYEQETINHSDHNDMIESETDHYVEMWHEDNGTDANAYAKEHEDDDDMMDYVEPVETKHNDLPGEHTVTTYKWNEDKIREEAEERAIESLQEFAPYQATANIAGNKYHFSIDNEAREWRITDDNGKEIDSGSGRAGRNSFDNLVEAARDGMWQYLYDHDLVRREDEHTTATFGNYTQPGGENYRELLMQWPDKPGRQFTDSHFGEIENILAHVRLKDRRGPDGEKILGIEEIQSDWHQQGREHGYQSNDKKAIAAAGEKLEAVNEEASKVRAAGYKQAREAVAAGKFTAKDVTDEHRRDQVNNVSNEDYKTDLLEKNWMLQNPEVQAVDAKLQAAQNDYHKLTRGIPDAPFKTSWPELAFKRMVRYAAEKGYDGISWTTGAQQVQRYHWNLKKQVDEIKWKKEDDGQIEIIATRGGRDVITKHYNPGDLKAAIGKHMADSVTASTEKNGSIHGDDLTVSDTGMAGFYDKIVPKIAQKLGEKFGAKVGKIRLEGSNNRGVSGDDVMREQGIPHDQRQRYWGSLADRDRKEMIDNYRKAGEEHHYLPITPEMKASVMKGQPLFQKGAVAERSGVQPLARGLIGTPSDKFTANQEKLVAAVKDVMDKMAPGAKLRVMKEMRGTGLGTVEKVMGAYWATKDGTNGVAHIVAASLESPNMMRAVRHEIIHYLKRGGFFTPQEWSTLEKAATDQGWVAKHNIESRYEGAPDHEKVEEAVAEEFSKWEAGDRSKTPGAIKPLFNRVAMFLKRVAAAARQILGAKATAEDIFHKVDTGEVGAREGGGGKKPPDNRVAFQKGEEPPERNQFLAAISNAIQKIEGALGRTLKGTVAEKFGEGYVHLLQPELVSPKALRTDALLAKYKVATQSARDVAMKIMQDHIRAWDKIGEKAQKAWIKAYETGQNKNDPYAAVHKSLMDSTHRLERAAMDSDPASYYRENYFAHVFEDPDKVQAYFRSPNMVKKYGPDWFMKARAFDLVEQAEAAGFKLKTYNPAEMDQMRLMAGQDMIQRMNLLKAMEANGLAERHETNGPLRGSGQRIIGPDSKAWYLHPEVMPIWHNAMDAKGLWQNETAVGSVYRGWMSLRSVMIPLKLGLSLFHPAHVATIHAATGLAAAGEHMAQGGNKMEGLIGGLKMALLGGLGRTNPLRGRMTDPFRGPGMGDHPAIQALNTLPSKRTPAQQDIVKTMLEGGFTPKMSEKESINFQRNWNKALDQKKYWKLLWPAAQRAMHALSAPFFEHWIPGLKAEAYLFRARMALQRDPTLATDDGRRGEVLRQISKDTDRTYGEMNYDTLFWNKTARDAFMGSFLSAGWKLAQVYYYKGLAAPFKLAYKGLKGNATKADVTYNMLFAHTYHLLGLMAGGIMAAMLGGEIKSLYDLYYPPSSEKNDDGSPIRYTLPFFNKEYFQLQHQINIKGLLGGSAAFLGEQVTDLGLGDMLRNQDYLGRTWISDFSNPREVATMAWDTLRPISFSNYEKADTRGTTTGKVLGAAGVNIAPGYATQSKFEQKVLASFDKSHGSTYTAYQGELRSQYKAAANNKDADKMADLRQEMLKTGMTPKQVGALSKHYNEPFSKYAFKELPADEQARLFPYASDDERVKFRSLLKPEASEYMRAHGTQ